MSTPALLLTIEDGRILVREFRDPMWIFRVGEEEVLIDKSITEVEAVAEHVREVLYEAASAETVRQEKEGVA